MGILLKISNALSIFSNHAKEIHKKLKTEADSKVSLGPATDHYCPDSSVFVLSAS